MKIRPDKKAKTAQRPKKANWWKKVDMWERGLFAGLPLTGVSLEKQQRAAPASTTLTPPVKLALCCTDNRMHVKSLLQSFKNAILPPHVNLEPCCTYI